MSEDEKNEHITVVKKLTRNGNSMCVNITHEASLLDLRARDRVKITIRRDEE